MFIKHGIILLIFLSTLVSCQISLEMLGPYICPQGSTLVSTSENRSQISGRSKGKGTYYNFNCMNPDGSIVKHANDAMGNSILIVVLGIILTPILFFVILGTLFPQKRKIRKRANKQQSSLKNYPKQSTTDKSLKQKLDELNTAFQEGLLTEEEFNDMRKEIITNFS